MKTILLGASGSTSAYRAADITSQLAKPGYDMEILMAESSTTFITPLTLQSLSKNPVHTDVMMEIDPSKINHIELAKKAGLSLVVPTSTDAIGKLVHGIADDSLSTAVLTLYPETPKIITPVMNTYMYQNPIVQRNIGILKETGYREIISRETLLVCGDHDRDMLAIAEDVLQTVMKVLTSDNKE